MTVRTNGAQIVCESLVREGVDTIFGVIGASTLVLYDTFERYPQLRHVMVRHEQGAAHAAEGYARATGRVGVCLATSGPGATNLVTGIADAYLDSVPIVAITGQVARSSIGKDAFQEVDITGITLPITKQNYLVKSAESLGPILREAFHIARSGRPGPVLVDIPRDVFVEEVEAAPAGPVCLPGYKPRLTGHPNQVRKAAALINAAQRPVVIAGHGVTISSAYRELAALAEKGRLPVVTTLLGVSCFPRSHALSCGMLGMHGMAYANLAVDAADLIIAIGARFSDRVTGKVSEFASKAGVIHIDVDPAELGKAVKVDVPIVGDARLVLQELVKLVEERDRSEWLRQLDRWRGEHDLRCHQNGGGLTPQYVVRELSAATGGAATIVTGVGQHQLWAAQHYAYEKANTLITSGGLGTMGFGLPAAIGVKMGDPQRDVWVVDGDGSFQMTLHELATVVQERLDIKIAIINNGYLGMVRQWQELFYGKRYVATPLSGPDYVGLARSYGVPALRVERAHEVPPAIREAQKQPGPFLIDFAVDAEEKVYPMVPPGAALAQFLEGPVQR